MFSVPSQGQKLSSSPEHQDEVKSRNKAFVLPTCYTNFPLFVALSIHFMKLAENQNSK
jgi:hypothetical protein